MVDFYHNTYARGKLHLVVLAAVDEHNTILRSILARL